MAQQTRIKPTTGGGTDHLPTDEYQYITICAPALATAETCAVSIDMPDGQTAVPALDINGQSGGLTATNKTRTYIGGPTYKLVLSATAASCGVYVDFGGRVM